MAMEAAIMPVPGSAVAHIVALTDVAVRMLAMSAQSYRDVGNAGNLPLNPPPITRLSPFKYTILATELTLPTAPNPITILTLILLLRSKSLSNSTLIGINTNVQSAKILMTP
jgi:hypothetical protein